MRGQLLGRKLILHEFGMFPVLSIVYYLQYHHFLQYDIVHLCNSGNDWLSFGCHHYKIRVLTFDKAVMRVNENNATIVKS